MITYLTGVSNEFSRAVGRTDLGLLGTPAGATWRQRDSYATWAADNGCFVDVAKPGSFNAPKWLAWLELAGDKAARWATLPDVVGDPVATYARSLPFEQRVRELGYRCSYVMQDGLERERFIWHSMLDRADDLFIGGSTEWKVGPEARALVAQASSLGIPVHMGRVNSGKRLAYAASIGCTSADGTFLKFCRRDDRETQLQRVLSWLDAVNGPKPAAPAIAA